MRATHPVFFRATIRRYTDKTGLATGKRLPIVEIKDASFYRQHYSRDDISNPVIFPDLNFTLPSNPEKPQYWSIISPSSSGKTTFLEILTGQHLCVPPTARSYPYLSTEYVAVKDPRLRVPAHALKYESRRESTDFSLLDYLKGNTILNPSEDEIAKGEYEEEQETLRLVIKQLKLKPLLGLPVGNLSNGQTRRARIAKALMGRPEVILLDEPFMGLDPPTLSSISTLLYRLAEKSAPRVVLALRPQDPLPEWITHVIYLDSDTTSGPQGPKEIVLDWISKRKPPQARSSVGSDLTKPKNDAATAFRQLSLGRSNGLVSVSERNVEEDEHQAQLTAEGDEALVEMEGVEIKYGERQILGDWQQRQNLGRHSKRGLWWTVKRGERWGIFGPNGSGKTTLLSLICSDHPQTYSLPIKLFGRSRLPTPGQRGISIFDIQSRIGHSSPEVHAFFPRNLTIRQSIENAWAETFRGKPTLSYERDMVVDGCLRWFHQELNPKADGPGTFDSLLCSEPRISPGRVKPTQLRKKLDAYLNRDIDWADEVLFGDLSVSAQRVVLLLRAIVKKPDLVILDEAFSGMADYTRDKCMTFLTYGENAVLVENNGSVQVQKTILAQGSRVAISGLEPRQALICISHLKEEVPSVVRNWLCLPEANNGKAVRFGHIKDTERDGGEWWDRMWGLSTE